MFHIKRIYKHCKRYQVYIHKHGLLEKKELVLLIYWKSKGEWNFVFRKTPKRVLCSSNG